LSAPCSPSGRLRTATVLGSSLNKGYRCFNIFTALLLHLGNLGRNGGIAKAQQCISVHICQLWWDINGAITCRFG
jgi:hypothetical protein